MPLTKIDVFTRDECTSLTEEVLQLDRFLVDRGGFYTLGAACYLDDPLAYPAIANAFNVVLGQALGKMYDRVNEVLSKHFGMPVGRMSGGFGLPSFHVFDEKSNGLEASIHIDEPYSRVSFQGVEWHDPFSFTLPVSIPTAGAGLDFWWGATERDIKKYPTTPEYVPYRLGQMYIHDGMTPHRIASVAPIPEGEMRVTLQGHGVHVEDGVLVYF